MATQNVTGAAVWAEGETGAISLPDNLVGTTVRVWLVGGGGAGASGNNVSGSEKGGGGGGAGGTILATCSVQAGDRLEYVTANPTRRNGSHTVQIDGEDTRVQCFRGSTLRWSVEAGGGSGGKNENPGSGGTNSASNVTIDMNIPGEDGGKGGTCNTSTCVNAETGDPPGVKSWQAPAIPYVDFGGLAGSTNTSNRKPGGGGGGAYVLGRDRYIEGEDLTIGVTAIQDADYICFQHEKCTGEGVAAGTNNSGNNWYRGGYGGDGASSSADVANNRQSIADEKYFYTNYEDREIDAPNFEKLSFDGENGRFGTGGGGAGVPWTTGSAEGRGGSGGGGWFVVEYTFQAESPTISFEDSSGNATGGETANDPFIVQLGSSFFEPGVQATVPAYDDDGNEILQGVSILTTMSDPDENGPLLPLSGAAQNDPEWFPAAGNYEVSYTAVSPEGLEETATRYVRVVDSSGPEISMIGSSIVQINLGDSYTDQGATALDLDGTNYTNNIVTTYTDAEGDTISQINTDVEGTYFVKYNVNDSTGNAAIEVSRTVLVSNVVYAVANTSSPIQTPHSSTIRFSDIQAARQLFTYKTSFSQTNLNSNDTKQRWLKDLSLNELRVWWSKYGMFTGSGEVASGGSSGSGTDAPFNGYNQSGDRVRAQDFHSGSALSIGIRVRAETPSPYRNYDNGAIGIQVWGAQNPNSQLARRDIYEVFVRSPDGYDKVGGAASGTYYSQTGRGTKELLLNNIGGRRTSDVGQGSGFRSDRGDPHTARTYLTKIKWRNSTSTSSYITYTGSSIRHGFAGSASCWLNTGRGTDAYFKWSGSTTANNKWSSRLVEHVGITEEHI